MEELLPLECYHAQASLSVRRWAAATGAAFGVVMGSVMGLGIGSALGPGTGVMTGLVTAGLTGAVFAAAWGSVMLRMRRTSVERAYDNDPKLMGECLEDSFRYRMPCSLMQRRRLVEGTLYIDHDRAAFVPIRKLANEIAITRFALAPHPFRTVRWREAPWWARWAPGEPVALEVAAGESVLRFLTPDSELAIARLTALMPPR